MLLFIFGYFLLFCTLSRPKNKPFKKNEKSTWRYPNFTQFYQESWSYAILFLRFGVWRMQLLLFILGYFLRFYPPYNPKNENFKTIILHRCTKNHDHMLYCSWDMVRDRSNFFSFWAFFLPFYPPNSLKNQNFKKIKKK